MIPLSWLDHSQAVEILQKAGLSDQVSAATSLADQVAIKMYEVGVEYDLSIHSALTDFFLLAATAVKTVENPERPKDSIPITRWWWDVICKARAYRYLYGPVFWAELNNGQKVYPEKPK